MRPQIKHGWVATKRRCNLSRLRRGSPKVSELLSISEDGDSLTAACDEASSGFDGGPMSTLDQTELDNQDTREVDRDHLASLFLPQTVEGLLVSPHDDPSI